MQPHQSPDQHIYGQLHTIPDHQPSRQPHAGLTSTQASSAMSVFCMLKAHKHLDMLSVSHKLAHPDDNEHILVPGL